MVEAEKQEVTFDQIRFRNYIPKTEDLQQFCMEKPSTKEIEKDLLEHMEATLKEVESSEMLNVAPKKPNWDLKRDVEKNVAILNSKTDRAIVNIIRSRLQAEQRAIKEELKLEKKEEKEEEDDDAGDGYAMAKTIGNAQLDDDIDDYE